jgi:hypothetical protein
MVVLGGMLSLLGEMVVLLVCPLQVGGMEPQFAASESFVRPLLVPAMSNTLGVDYLLEGVDVIRRIDFEACMIDVIRRIDFEACMIVGISSV